MQKSFHNALWFPFPCKVIKIAVGLCCHFYGLLRLHISTLISLKDFKEIAVLVLVSREFRTLALCKGKHLCPILVDTLIIS